MDARPKSNKLKRIETKLKLARKAERQGLVPPQVAAVAEVVRAEQVLRRAKAVRGDYAARLGAYLRGEVSHAAAGADLAPVVGAFGTVKPTNLTRPGIRLDLAAFGRLILLCRDRTDLLTRQDARPFVVGLLALSAHRRQWVREPEDWVPRTHNAYRQFHALVRHLTALYDVPTFFNTAWLEGLTVDGIAHQLWFLHVAQGANIRTASRLPVALSKKQAHLFLQAPGDFDVLGALRWAQVRELGGDERLVRSILATRAATDFAQDDFWLTVIRWLIAQPLLDPVHHGPIIDYLHDQRYTASVPNPAANLPGQPLLVPPQPNLTMKGRSPATLLRAVTEWHRRLARIKPETDTPTTWESIGLQPFSWEEGHHENRRVYQVVELLSSRDLRAEGDAMRHCVASYAWSCAARRSSIWSLRMRDAAGNDFRLLTLEVATASRSIVQARQKLNARPSPKEIAILQRWAMAGGPSLSKHLA